MSYRFRFPFPTMLSIFCILIAGFSSDLPGQSRNIDLCGTVLTAEQAQQVLMRQDLFAQAGSFQRVPYDVSYQIPVAMRIIRRSNGTGGIDPADIASVLDSVNVLFASMNVSVYELVPYSFVDEDFFYDDMVTLIHYDSLRSYSPVTGAINVYWVPNESGFIWCGHSSFPGSFYQGIIMNNNCGGAGVNNSILAHELGHYFYLFHTHEISFGVECPNGTNCSTTGDLLCDTPADPNLLDHVSAAPACTYDNFAPPPGGCDATPYDPPVHNIMSYSRRACMVEFTPQQVDRARTTIEQLRPELFTGFNGVRATPAAINPFLAKMGTVHDTVVTVVNVGSGQATLANAYFDLGYLQIISGYPVDLDSSETTELVVRFDAGSAASACDLTDLSDTLILTFSPPDGTTLRVPITVQIVHDYPTSAFTSIGTGCFSLQAPPTAGLGGGYESLVDPSGAYYLSGSLLLGVVDGSDTTVYMDLHSQDDFLYADRFVTDVDAYGRTTQGLRFATKDARFHGDVIYKYGYSPTIPDSCSFIEAEYRVRNECGTPVAVTVGIFADADITTGPVTDEAIVEAGNHFVRIQNTGGPATAFGLVNLTPCSSDRNLRAILNSSLIYPYGGLRDGDAYKEMKSSNSADITGGSDVSILLTFGEFNIPSGGEQVLRAALVDGYDYGPNIVSFLIESFEEQIDPRLCELSVPEQFGTLQAAIDFANSFDKIMLAPGTYTGAGNRDITFSNKKVSLTGREGAAATIIDCQGSEGDPHRAFRFVSSSEDSNLVVSGLTIRNGAAPLAGNFGHEGGAVHIDYGARPQFRDCVFENNFAIGQGGAVSVQNSGAGTTWPTFERCTFRDNGYSLAVAGAIAVSAGARLTVRDSHFEGNFGTYVAALGVFEGCIVEVTNSRFVGNHADVAGALFNAGQMTVLGCVFDSNAAQGGGALYSADPGSMTVTKSTFTRNFLLPHPAADASVLLIEDGVVNLVECVIAFNEGGNVAVCDEGGLTVTCSNIFGNTPADFTACLAGQNGVNDNFSADPVFCDLPARDYRVSSTSPCAPANNSCGQLIGAGSAACGNTPAGADVMVALGDSLTVTFAEVSTDGETSVAAGTIGPNPPSGYQIVPSTPELYFDLTTTAPYSGTIEVCFLYDSANLGGGSELDLTLFHYDGDSWVDITSSLDTDNNRICGVTGSLSPFIMALPSSVCGDADGSAIISISDVVYLINYIFGGGPAPNPLPAGDGDCNGIVTISDAVYLINYIFAGGPVPCAACP